MSVIYIASSLGKFACKMLKPILDLHQWRSSVFAECQMTRRSMCSVLSVMVGIIQLVWAFRPGCSIATGDGSVTPVGERRVKDIICISAMMRSRYFAITLNSTPQNLAWPLKYNCTYVWIHYCYVTVFSNGHRPLVYCGQLLDVSWGLNFFFTLSKIMWKIMKWNYKHLAHGK